MNLFQNPLSNEGAVLNPARLGGSLDCKQVLGLKGNTDVFPFPLKHRDVPFFQLIVKRGYVVGIPEPRQLLS